MIIKNILRMVFQRCLTLSFIAAVSFVSIEATAATLTVGTCPGAGFSTIQSAINAANAGDSVNVCPGSYPEQVLINKSLTLQGIAVSNQDAATIQPPVGGLLANATALTSGVSEAAQVLVIPGSGPKRPTSVTLRNLTIDGANNGIGACVPMVLGILYQNTAGSISNVATRNQMLSGAFSGCDSGTGIRVESSADVPGTKSIIIQNSTVHDYQKNGITALGDGSSIKFFSNFVRGQGPAASGTQNGIQVSFGATGKIQNNNIIDNIFAGSTGFAASGILVFASNKVQVTGNTVGNNQFGIAVASTAMATADKTMIANNSIFGARDLDGVDLCSNNNVVTDNSIASSDEAGIYLDGGCGSTGNNNSVKSNIVNETCAAVLEGSGTNGNMISANSFFNVTNMDLPGDQCPAGLSVKLKTTGESEHLRPAPSS